MLPSDSTKSDGGARQGSPAFDSALADFRAALSAHVMSAEADARISELIQQLARVAKAQGLKAEALVVAVRTAWDREVMQRHAHSTRWAPDERDANRHRVIGVLLDAYHADS